ncbi:mavicyanin [Cucurbita maxima]|uniref:Mavicyanin n=1 Tax=Cucurbita maxima TaxID=3661 RepID=A0A6J1HQP3_CUCMA|nr:mavicyanin [Cucurbita maxima]
MGLGKKVGWPLLWICTMGLFTVSAVATVHKVGDSTGWTTLVPFDYAKWASSNKFRVGDSLLFNYNNKFHNVLQVDQEQFKSCNSSSPAASYTSGADSITLKRPGTFYFLCGIPGHCQLGQKVEIKVDPGSSSALLAPSSAPSQSPLPNGPAPLGTPSALAPPPSAASTLSYYSLLCLPLAAYAVAFYSVCV